MLRAHKHWLPVVLWMGFIFAMSTGLGSSEHTSRIIEPLLRWLKPDISPDAIDLVHTIVRKGGHLTEYAILALLLRRALRISAPARGALKTAALALLVSAAYASTDEYHQTFVPGRTPAVHDVMIDTSGAFLALAAAAVVRRTRGAER